ncbi:MAG: GNAT family N-acetyltransferase [Actinomycetota bacterium]
MPNLPEIALERLVLRRMNMGDAGDVFEYARDPEVARFTVWDAHRSIDDSRAFLTSVIRGYARREVAAWGVVHRAEGRLIGTCGYNGWSRVHCRAELGYAFGRRFWNQGLATEAVGALIAFGFNRLDFNRIEGFCVRENLPSARVMEKAGMIYEGLLRQSCFAKGAYRDLKMYSILREDYSPNPTPPWEGCGRAPIRTPSDRLGIGDGMSS